MMPWFRFYSEAIKDTKLRRIARKVRTSPAEVVGVWCIILSLASESPTRGSLFLSDGLPVTEDDIADIAGCDVSETLRELECNGMVTVTGEVIAVTAWDKRQFGSDSSTPRVRQFREKHGQKGETFPKRSGNVAVTPPESDPDTETDQPPSPPKTEATKPNGHRDGVDDFSLIETAHASFVGAKISLDQAKTYAEWLKVTTPAAIVAALQTAKANNVKAPFPYAMKILANQHKAGELPANGPKLAEWTAPLEIVGSWM